MNRLGQLLFTALLVGGVVVQVIQRPWTTPIAWDGFGYHLYLQLTFIHDDLGMNDPATIEGIFRDHHPSDTFYQAHRAPTGNMVIRYTPGLALIHLPGFLVAHAVALGSDHPADGLSFPYQVAVTCTAILFLFLGLWWTLQFLRRFFEPWPAFLATGLLLYGTNLMDQAVEQQLMTHLYSFSLYALLLLTTDRLHGRPGPWRALGTGAVLGMLVLVRPTNAIAVLIPILWPFRDLGPWGKLQWVWEHQRKVLVALVLGALPPVLLLLSYWKVYGGAWIFDSYQNPGEGLDLFYPHLHRFLFSFRKGWFIYTPLMLVAAAGLLFAMKESMRPIRRALGVFLVVHIYIVSSWTIWYYPGGFGQRAGVDVLPLMGVGLAAALAWGFGGSAWRRVLLLTGIALLVALLQFQVLQQRRGVFPPDRMTAAYYWSAFLDLRPAPDIQHLLAFDRPTYQVDEPTEEVRPHAKGPWTQDPGAAGSEAPGGVRAFLLNGEHLYSPAFEVPFRELTDGDHAWVEVTGLVYVQDTSSTRGSIVVHMDHDGAYGYRAWDIQQAARPVPGEWSPFRVVYLTPHARRPWDMLRTYAWHQGGAPFWMKDLQVQSHVPR
ncbi:MAG: hypothetical protein R2810_09715 [Flavobacteriales bacterium]